MASQIIDSTSIGFGTRHCVISPSRASVPQFKFTFVASTLFGDYFVVPGPALLGIRIPLSTMACLPMLS